MKRSTLVILVVALVILLDQALKIWVKTNMDYGSSFDLLGLSWAKIHFVENPGMAFGIEFGGQTGKLILSLFRIVAVGALIYYLNLLVNAKAKKGLLISFALILAGALGNILDSAFYGLLFDRGLHFDSEIGRWMPYAHLAELNFEGYAPFLMGSVVDMLYFPMITNAQYPDWVPFVGGNRFEFFRPVFNIADSAITIGVLNLLLFQRSFFNQDQKVVEPEARHLEDEQKLSDEDAESPLI
ncbi:MAG: lipoprotein signal peptidase [Bacteroidota bacterium]